jgi:hypothetical protein
VTGGQAAADSIEDVAVGLPDGPKVIVSVYQLQTAGPVTIAQLKGELDALVGQFVKENSAKLVDSRQVKLGPNDCLDYRIQYTKDGKALESRRTTFVVGDRQYLAALETAAADAAAQSAAFDQLVASFDAPMPGAKGERLVRAVAATKHNDDYEPQDARAIFQKGTSEAEVIFWLEKTKPGYAVKGQWVADRVEGYSAGEKILEREIGTREGSVKGYFSLSASQGLPSGSYVLELRLDNVLLRKVKLQVGP